MTMWDKYVKKKGNLGNIGNLKPNRQEKMVNQKVSHAGYSFASKLEAALFDHLKLLEKAGEIKDIQVQPQCHLTRARILFKPDFAAWNTINQEREYFEAKGHVTAVYAIKRRLWPYYGDGPLHVFGGRYTRLSHIETILQRKDADRGG